MATPELNCSATYPEVPTIPKSSFLVVCFKYMDVAVAYRLNLRIVYT